MIGNDMINEKSRFPFRQSGKQLRIAMVVRLFSESGGLELYTHRLVQGLLAKGHAVTVFCERCDSQLSDPLLTVNYFAAAKNGASKLVRFKHYFQAASAAIKQAGSFDIVHSQHLPMRGADVVSFHNHTTTRLQQVGLSWERALSRWKNLAVPFYRLQHKQDEILCQTPVLMFSSAILRDDFYKTYKLVAAKDPASYIVAYPGADFPGGKSENIEQFYLSEKTRQTTDLFTFLFVGKGYRKKGLDILLSACRLLKQNNRHFRLLIAGLKEKPIDTLRKQLLNLQNEVTYLGFCQNMADVYAQASAIVLPSRIEPFGMSAVQGMLYGLVPIVSRVSGVAEVLSDGVDSLILKDHLSATELAVLMEKLIADPKLTDKLKLQAYDRAKEITWNHTVESALKAYEICRAKSQSSN